MTGALGPRLVLVTRETEYDQLLARHATRGQADVFLRRRSQSLEGLDAQRDHVRDAVAQIRAAVPKDWRIAAVRRAELDRFLFGQEDLVVAVGQDGLVANVAKYLSGQAVVGVNADPARNPGILVPHKPGDVAAMLALHAAGKLATERRTMVQAELDDGQRLLALNEVFVGHTSHQSARYTIAYAGRQEAQSSSGVIVATGTGATGWALSISRATGVSIDLRPQDKAAVFLTREPWPSLATGVGIVSGRIAAGDILLLVSRMNEGGVVFADGMEGDRLDFAWGRTLRVSVSDRQLRFVPSRDPQAAERAAAPAGVKLRTTLSRAAGVPAAQAVATKPAALPVVSRAAARTVGRAAGSGRLRRLRVAAFLVLVAVTALVRVARRAGYATRASRAPGGQRSWVDADGRRPARQAGILILQQNYLSSRRRPEPAHVIRSQDPPMPPTSPALSGRPSTLSWAEIRTLTLASLGGVLEFYDFIIFVFFTAAIAKLFFPAAQPDWLRQVETYGLFAAGYLARPLGGIVTAHFGDTRGRKRVFTLSVLLMAIPTLLIGLLPTYAAIGPAAPLLLLAMRLMQGAAIGGEAPGGWVFVAEHAPAGRVGLALGLLTSGLTGGILLGSLAATGLNLALTPAQVLAGWWRLPFLAGGLFGFVAMVLRRWLQETPVYLALQARAATERELPLRAVLRTHRPAVLASMASTWTLTAAIVVVVLITPSLLQKQFAVPAREALLANLAASATLCFSAVAVGAATDRFGLRRTATCVLLLLAGSTCALYWSAAHQAQALVPLYMLAGAGAGAATLTPVLMVRAFPPAVRFSGMSASYNVAYALVGGATPLLIVWLAGLNRMAPAWYVAGVSVVGLLAVLAFPVRMEGASKVGALPQTPLGP